ncbi:hypothetical protein HHI36_010082 [Cryptolaemus montrouzieri]|uniref:Uncharacterized protein n=1 Tax=Cryptolaemus montrouzieri TaxID=559131 RepID=A0ABD2MHM4_9CUCU
MSIVCEEVFDEQSHPSIEEIKDYAIKIGIDPSEEPQLLPIAAEGLMKALPAAWKPWFVFLILTLQFALNYRLDIYIYFFMPLCVYSFLFLYVYSFSKNA